MSKQLVVVVAGVTCGGKSTIASKLMKMLDNVNVLHQDEFYYPESSKHLEFIPELNYHDYDRISAYDMDRMITAIESNSRSNILVLDGILLLDDVRIINCADLKFFFVMDKESCWSRRKIRTYLPPEPDGYFEKYAWPEYKQHLNRVKETIPDVIFLNGTDSIEHNVAIVINKIKNKIN
ncbi:nicotinamide riboside kinase 1 [Adelges cooleyi]|uniref:nicotinamide riboside kinase 1 n=1 Tax=Adelges cooleyi TaxID=133065 RepID=UPI00217F5826|nr:nicotinamide riboside kinase 1 [Adelges cooleyi]